MSAVVQSCRPRFSPQHSWNLVKPAVVQETLRLVFTRWGLPKRFRVDNGTPWGSAGDWPTDLALWLIGLGVAMTWNPARTPEELQRRMDDMDRIQREVYPSVKGQSRWQAFPGLQKVDRRYSKNWEKS